MDELELAWQTYDFHTSMIYDLEQDHQELISRLNKLFSINLDPSKTKKLFLKKKINKSFNHLLLMYKKQIDAISDLIKIYKSDMLIPKEREMNVRYLFDLKNVTATMIEEFKVHRKEINELLG